MVRFITKCFLPILGLLFFRPGYSQFQLLRKVGHGYGVHFADISKNGKYFLTLGPNNKCLVWESITGNQINIIYDVYNAKFASDGEHIYIAATDKTFRLVDLAGKTIRNFSSTTYKKGYDNTRLFYPEDNLFINDLSVFNIHTGFQKNLSTVGWGLGQDYSPTKKLFAVADLNNNRISFQHVPTGEQRGFIQTGIHKKFHKKIRFSPNGERVLIYSGDTLQVLSTTTGEILRTLVAKGMNHVNAIGFALFDRSGDFVIWSAADYNKGNVICSEIATGKTSWQKPLSKKNTDLLLSVTDNIAAISGDGNALLITNAFSGLLLNPENGKTLQTFEYLVESYTESVTTNQNKTQLGAIMKNYVVFWNLETGQMEDTVASGSIGKDAENTYFYDFEGKELTKHDNKGAATIKYPGDILRIETINKGAYDLTVQFHTKASRAACAEKEPSTILRIIDNKTNKTVFTRSCRWAEATAGNTEPILALKEKPNVNEINFYNFLTGKKLFTIPNKEIEQFTNHMHFSPNDNYLLMRSNAYGIVIFDVKNKRSYTADSTELAISKDQFSYVAGFTPDEKYAVIYHNPGFIKFLDLSTGKVNKSETFSLRISGVAPKIGFSKNGNHLFLSGSGSTIQVYDRTEKKIAATLYPFPETGDWAVLTSSGLFDASKGAQNSMYYKSASNITPLGSVFEKYYTPKLLPRLLSGEKFETPDINKISAIPTVSIEYTEGNRNLVVENEFERVVTTNKSTGIITVKANCTTDKITEIRLYHNGKLAGSSRNLVVEDASPQSSLTRTFTITLTEGNNVFNAVAINSQRSESKPAFINAKYIPEKKLTNQTIQSVKPTLHMIIVGINTYKNPKYNLNYAHADAASFKTTLESGAKDLFSGINTYHITDNDATKQGIQNAFEKVKQNANAEDLFIFYYAGHGVLDTKNEFYLVPYEVTQLYGNEQALKQSGISAALLEQNSKDIKAQKQLFILDACQSAGVFANSIAMRGAAEEKAIAQLARSTGTHWLTASGSDQMAAEFSQLGHGLFTYCLLQALKGDADNGDKRITVKEIDSYLQNKVPEISQKFKGSAQYPASYGGGNDFPIVIIKP